MCKYVLKIRHSNGDATLVELADDEALAKRIEEATALAGTAGYSVFELAKRVVRQVLWAEEGGGA